MRTCTFPETLGQLHRPISSSSRPRETICRVSSMRSLSWLPSMTVRSAAFLPQKLTPSPQKMRVVMREGARSADQLVRRQPLGRAGRWRTQNASLGSGRETKVSPTRPRTQLIPSRLCEGLHPLTGLLRFLCPPHRMRSRRPPLSHCPGHRWRTQSWQPRSLSEYSGPLSSAKRSLRGKVREGTLAASSA